MKQQLKLMNHHDWSGNAAPNRAWIENYVQNLTDTIFQNHSPWHSHFTPFGKTSGRYDIFDSHRYIYVKCPIPNHISSRDISLLVNSKKLMIEHSGTTEEVTLPSEVNPSRSTARLKDGILEIRMLKSEEAEPYQKVLI